MRVLSRDLVCPSCHTVYSSQDGILDLRPVGLRVAVEEGDWEKHWSAASQESNSQRFFSFYRRAVFARTVRHFLDHYFPESGFFLEAGAGTSETSMLVSKHGGKRILAALDLIPAVLNCTHPVMDIRIAGDIFHLPFGAGTIDGCNGPQKLDR